MTNKKDSGPEEFQFRDLHQCLFMGTASDRYAGWIGQIYSKERYAGKISQRAKKVGGKSFQEEVLPVESVEEYFQHFSILELDFTFYQMLLDQELQQARNYHVLNEYGTDLRIMGAFDKMQLREGKRAIKSYMQSLLPLVERGGFIPFCDHRCPPDVNPQDYLYYLDLKEQMFGMK